MKEVMPHKWFRRIIIVLCILSFALMWSSAKKDSPTWDEPEHLMAGYSYLRYSDYRFNVMHPPLVKDIAALPLLLLNLRFPYESEDWNNYKRNEVARAFLFESGNFPLEIFGWSRTAVITSFVLVVLLMTRWMGNVYGQVAGMLFAGLLLFNINFLAHARYITTDVFAGLGFLAGVISIAGFATKPSTKSLLSFGALFALAQMTKHSVAFLYPFVFVAIAFHWFFSSTSDRNFSSLARQLLWGAAFIIYVFVLISLFYHLHMLNHPEEKLGWYMKWASTLFPEFMQPAYLLTYEIPALRPFGWYITGVFRIGEYVATSDKTAILLGQPYRGGRLAYFPTLIFFKETLPILLLSGLTLGIVGSQARTVLGGSREERYLWFKRHLLECLAVLVVVLYFIVAVTANLNIGVRHVISMSPLLIFLISVVISRMIAAAKKPLFLVLGTGVLLVWNLGIAVSVWPYYLSFFNTLAGGHEDGHLISVDSNYDWGQDLLRLKDFLDERDLKKVKLDYFGFSPPEYFLGERVESFRYPFDKPEPGEAFALSVTFIYLPSYKTKDELEVEPWLDEAEYIGTAGTSIRVYRMPEDE